MKRADAILCGDIHLRETVPICRKDDFLAAQWKKLAFIKELQEINDCPVLCSGDLFDYWKPSPELLSITMGFLPHSFYTVYGNHDLPQHNFELRSKSGIHTLYTANKLNVLGTCHYGQKPNVTSSLNIKDRRILVWHTMTYKIDPPYPGCTDPRARSILHNYSDYDLVLTGDNHEPFTQEYKGRLLVNPGSMMRQDADQIDYKPAVWLWYADTNTVKPVYFPIDENAVSRDHLDKVKEKENRISAFIEMLDTSGLDFVNFEKNLNVFLKKNKIEEDVKEIIYKLIG